MNNSCIMLAGLMVAGIINGADAFREHQRRQQAEQDAYRIMRHDMANGYSVNNATLRDLSPSDSQQAQQHNQALMQKKAAQQQKQ